MSKPIICVTGGSGYIATHVCRILVETGKYTVRCTVRSKSPEKTDYLDSIGVEIFDGCDLLLEGSFDKAFEDANILFTARLHFSSEHQGRREQLRQTSC